MSVEKLFNTDRFDRSDYFEEDEQWDTWTRDDLLMIVEKAKATMDENSILINDVAGHPLSTVEDLKNYALSGKFSIGVIKRVLMNDNCSEEIIRGLYNKSSDDNIFDFIRVNDVKKYGDGAFEKYVKSYIDSINNLAKDHKNFPDDLKK
ncbi:MAG: hypothetical protein QNL31_03105 [Flavobacteriaceae bacterium]